MNAHTDFRVGSPTTTVDFSSKREQRRRDAMLSVRADEVEAHAIREAANIRGVSVGQFMRDAAMREAAFPFVRYTQNGLLI